MENQTSQEQKPKKKLYGRWWFWVLIVIAIIILTNFRYVYFAETRGTIRDENGNPLSEIKISMYRECSVSSIVVSNTRVFQSSNTETDNNGNFKFGPLIAGFRLSARDCQTHITAFKSGYCGEHNSCSEVRKKRGLKIDELQSSMLDEYHKGNLYYYQDLYYWPQDAWEETTLASNKSNISLKLIRLR